jgi:acyl-CoA synthetase (AMP-forming)/AMP-acid ligase II
MPHISKGELPVAAVVRAAADLSEESLLAWCDQRIAAYRRPRRVVFIDNIPQSFAMKPLRRAVRQQLIDMGITVEARSDRGASDEAVLS